MSDTSPDRHNALGQRSAFDQSVKRLLADALANAPQPPNLELNAFHKDSRGTLRRPNYWIIAGGIAASLAGLLAIANIKPNPAPAQLSNTSEPITVPVPQDTATTVSASPSTVPAVSATSIAAPIVATPPILINHANVIFAGSDGISMLPSNSSLVQISKLPADIAIEGPDGNIYFSPSVAEGAQDADSRPRVYDVRTKQVTAIDVPNETNQGLELLDVATIQGELTLLYLVQSPVCFSGADPACITSLRTFQPATNRASTLLERIDWESGWNRFTLGNNGIVFGSTFGLVLESPMFFNISTGATPTLSAVGLLDDYDECDECPTSFTIDRSGAYVSWIEGPPGNRRVVVFELATGNRFETPIARDVDDLTISSQGTLRIANISITNGALVKGEAVFTNRFVDGSAAPPIRIDLASGEIQNLAPGTVATIS
jgi:hypothetical protein